TTMDLSRDNFYNNSQITIEKGDHVRLQDIRLSYDFRIGGAKKESLTHFQMYLYANNIGIIWRANHYGIDPDNQAGFPTPRSLAIGVNANF
ncbi:MAG TPA: hypothetical protein VKR58_03085, partial [Aquella sp.]|nr:hypothetical protein [Aquella sp.]